MVTLGGAPSSRLTDTLVLCVCVWLEHMAKRIDGKGGKSLLSNQPHNGDVGFSSRILHPSILLLMIYIYVGIIHDVCMWIDK